MLENVLKMCYFYSKHRHER